MPLRLGPCARGRRPPGAAGLGTREDGGPPAADYPGTGCGDALPVAEEYLLVADGLDDEPVSGGEGSESIAPLTCDLFIFVSFTKGVLPFSFGDNIFVHKIGSKPYW